MNGHGKYLAVTLIDYGSEEINAFIVNVGVSSSIFNKSIVELTNKFLAEIEIKPKFYLQDAENLAEEYCCNTIMFHDNFHLVEQTIRTLS